MDNIWKKSPYLAAVAALTIVPVYQLTKHGRSDMMKDRTPVAAVAQIVVSTSTSSSYDGTIGTCNASGLVQDTVAGNWHDARPVDIAIPCIVGPKKSGTGST
jgi:hypothetical protein